ncbi:NADH dehydrogenase subunit 5, partial [Tricharina praecox]|uniref:NADH dehydrogenase subunit 5 n=1 Tax=Tricharina praecox TaxID=43433 RepID=UPI00221ED7F0
AFFNQRFLVELFYNRFVTGLVLKLGGHTTKIIDKGSIFFLYLYINKSLRRAGLLILSKNIASMETGVITTYALYILTGLVFYILIPFLTLADDSLLILIIFALLTVINTSYIKKNSIL